MDKKLLAGVVALVVLVLGFSAYVIVGRSDVGTDSEVALAASPPSIQAEEEESGQPGVERAEESGAVTQEPGTTQEASGAPVQTPSPGAVVETPQVNRRTAGPLPGGIPADSTRATSGRNRPTAGPSSGRSGEAGDTAIRPAGGGGPSRESSRATFGLLRTFQGLGILEEGDTPLTTEQAKSILALVEPLRSQESLTSEKATSTLEKLEALLTPAQREALEEMGQRRRGGGRRTSGAGGPGESGATGERAGRERPAGSPESSGGTGGRQRPPDGGESRRSGAGMENMNPFTPDSDNPMAQRMSERIETVFDALKAKAGQ